MGTWLAIAPAMSSPIADSRTLGRLRTGACWALAHGDASGLRGVAIELAAIRPDLRSELLEIADACRLTPDRAAGLWTAVEPRLVS